MRSVNPNASKHQIQGLNGLRGLAALLVVMCHLEIPGTIRAIFPSIDHIKEFGWVGVPIYFVLSGYLITWLALQEKRNTGDFSLRFFFLRRILRLWPIYILTCTLGLWAWSYPSLDAISASPEWIAPLMTFTTNIAITSHWEHFGVLGAYWTLALEEQFYVLSGLSFKYLSSRYMIRLSIIGLIFCLIWRLYPLPSSCFLHYRIQLPVSLVSIVLGCMLAWIYPKMQSQLVQLKTMFSIMLVVEIGLLAYFELPFPQTARASCFLMTCADLLAVISVILAIGKPGFIHSCLNFRPLIYVGKISLCMYAVNLPVIYFYSKYRFIFALLRPDSDSYPWASFFYDVFLIYFIIIFISSLWQLVDAPITQLRHRCRAFDSQNLSKGLSPIIA